MFQRLNIKLSGSPQAFQKEKRQMASLGEPYCEVKQQVHFREKHHK